MIQLSQIIVQIILEIEEGVTRRALLNGDLCFTSSWTNNQHKYLGLKGTRMDEHAGGLIFVWTPR